MSNLYLNRSNFLLYIVVVAVIDLPRVLIEMLNLPMPYYFGSNPPLLIPFIMMVFLLYIILVFKKFNKAMPMGSVDLLMLITIVIWSFLYLFHSDYSGGGWESWNGAYLITTNIWFFISFYFLKCYSYFYDIRFKIADITINVLTCLAVFFLFLVFIDSVVGLSIHAQLQNNNGLALKSVFCLLLLFFFSRTRKYYSFSIIFFIHLFLIIHSHSRGALFVLLMLLAYKVYVHIITYRIKSIADGTFILTSIILGVVFYEDILIYINISLSPFDAFGDAYKHIEGYGFESGLISAVSRVQSLILLFVEFLKHPLLGIGYQNSMDVRSFGYVSHTYYLFPLAAYGVVGSLPYFLMIFIIFWHGFKYNKESTIAVAIFTIMFFTFINDMPAWLAIIFFLLRTRHSCDDFDATYSRKKYTL